MRSSSPAELARGQAALNAGRLQEAAAILSDAAAHHPDVAEIHARLGEARHALGAFEPAIASYREALRLRPEPVLNGRLGIALCQVGRLAEAVAAFEAALALDPSFLDARVNLGMTRFQLGDHLAGKRLMRQALALKPDHAESWLTHASAAYGLGDETISDIAARRTLAISPGQSAALALRALVLRRLGQPGKAFGSARRAVVVSPRQVEMLVVAAVALRDIGRAEEAVGMFRRALAVDPRSQEARAAFIMCLNYAASATPADLLAEARAWERWHTPPARATPRAVAARGQALRVGLVSGDLKRHAVGYFLAGTVPFLDRRRIELQCFSMSRVADDLTLGLKAAATRWHDITATSDEDAAQLIARERIDILVDMSGYTGGGRLTLFARKPAPVQAAWIGYFGTTGLSTIDWLIADRHLVPPGEERWFSERVLRLPDSYVCYQPPKDAPDVSPPPSEADGVVTFGSCNALAKITRPTVALWSRILAAVPGARLLLKTGAFDAAMARDDTRRAFAQHGIAPDRLLLEGWSAYGDFLKTYGRIDVALDPFPFCGGLTTVETLWMGVPLVSLAADRFAGRQSLSYLSTIGHPELCARTEDEYVAIAVGLARDADARARLRGRLRADMAVSPLLDGERFARNLESAFETMAGR